MSDENIVFRNSEERLVAGMLHALKFGIVTLAVDATYTGVVVPDHVRTKDRLIFLQYGLDLVVPIPDLRIDRAGVLATLAFSRVPHETFVPWIAVRDIIFEGNDVPLISEEELDSIAAEHLRGLAPLPVPQGRPRLRRITQLDVFSPAEVVEVDPAQTSRAFAERGLRAVK